jgi:hypothetical protein
MNNPYESPNNPLPTNKEKEIWEDGYNAGKNVCNLYLDKTLILLSTFQICTIILNYKIAHNNIINIINYVYNLTGGF